MQYTKTGHHHLFVSVSDCLCSAYTGKNIKGFAHCVLEKDIKLKAETLDM